MNQRYLIIIGGLIAGLAVLTFAGWRLFIHPLAADYAAAVAQKVDLDQQLQTARDTAAQFGKFKAQAENMRRDLDFYSSRTDGSLNEVQVNQMISTLGKQAGLREWQITVKAQPAARAGGMDQFGVEVKFHSDFERMGNFVNACVSQRRIVVPASVSLKSLEDPDGVYNDTLSVDMNLTVYGGLAAKPARRS